jgi:hypothetical protein
MKIQLPGNMKCKSKSVVMKQCKLKAKQTTMKCKSKSVVMKQCKLKAKHCLCSMQT